jgi:non-ribosomal peptide synthetase component E (peptide arylation enzyme)
MANLARIITDAAAEDGDRPAIRLDDFVLSYGLLDAATARLAGLLAAKGLTRDQIRTQIESQADRIAGTGTLWTKGRINACRAVGGTGC